MLASNNWVDHLKMSEWTACRVYPGNAGRKARGATSLRLALPSGAPRTVNQPGICIPPWVFSHTLDVALSRCR